MHREQQEKAPPTQMPYTSHPRPLDSQGYWVGLGAHAVCSCTSEHQPASHVERPTRPTTVPATPSTPHPNHTHHSSVWATGHQPRTPLPASTVTPLPPSTRSERHFGSCTTPWPPFTPNPPLPSVPRRERQGVREGVPRVVLLLLAHVILASGEQNDPGGAVGVELWRGGVEIERVEMGLGSKATLG